MTTCGKRCKLSRTCVRYEPFAEYMNTPYKVNGTWKCDRYKKKPTAIKKILPSILNTERKRLSLMPGEKT